MVFIRLLFSVFTLWWAGIIAMAFLNREMKARFSILEILAFSWMAGMGIVSLQLFVYSLLGISYNVFWVSVPWVLFLVFCTTVTRFRRSFLNALNLDLAFCFHRSWVTVLFIMIAAWQVLFVFIFGLSAPISGWDAWGIWFLKGKIFFETHGISSSFLKSGIPMHPDYPLLIPLSVTWIYTFLGQPDDQLARILCSLQYVSLIIIFYYFVKELSSRWNAAFFGILILLVPIFILHGGGLLPTLQFAGLYQSDFVGYADLTIAIYFLIAGGFLALGVVRKSGGFLLVSCFFAALSAWTKNEGLSFLFFIILTVLFCGWRHRLLTVRRCVWMGVFLGLFVIPWILYKKSLQIGNEYVEHLSAETAKNLFKNFHIILSWLIKYMFRDFGLYNFVWFLYFFLLIRNVVRFFSSPVLVLNLLFWAQFGSCIFIYLITPREIQWQLGTSLDRIFLQLIPLVLLISSVYFAQMFKSSKPLAV